MSSIALGIVFLRQEGEMSRPDTLVPCAHKKKLFLEDTGRFGLFSIGLSYATQSQIQGRTAIFFFPRVCFALFWGVLHSKGRQGRRLETGAELVN